MNDTLELPNDIDQLKLIVADLNRRLQNAQHTIESERMMAREATARAEGYRKRLSEISSEFRLDATRIEQKDRKFSRESEAQSYESNKILLVQLIEQLKMEELDVQVARLKFTPLKVTRLREKVKNLEKQQESRKLLLQQYSELDQLNESLSNASQHGHLDKCLVLLKNGANANYVDSAGYIPMHYAIVNGAYDIVKLMLQFGADNSSYLTGNSPVVLAARHGHVAIIKLLTEFGASLEDRGVAGFPALIIAMQAGHSSTLEYLLELGADINACDDRMNSALHLAMRLPVGSVDVMNYLIQKGINIHHSNNNGETAFQLALQDKNNVAIQFLKPFITGNNIYIDEDDREMEANPPPPATGLLVEAVNNAADPAAVTSDDTPLPVPITEAVASVSIAPSVSLHSLSSKASHQSKQLGGRISGSVSGSSKILLSRSSMASKRSMTTSSHSRLPASAAGSSLHKADTSGRVRRGSLVSDAHSIASSVTFSMKD